MCAWGVCLGMDAGFFSNAFFPSIEIIQFLFLFVNIVNYSDFHVKPIYILR